MKTLYLLRHAEAVWNNAHTIDFDRSLSARGLANAASLNAFLIDLGVRFDKVLCSAAERTRQTQELVLQNVEIGAPTEFLDSLYYASDEVIIDRIKDQSNGLSTLLIIGHNPAMHHAFEQLSGTEIAGYPTCTLSSLTVVGDWRNIQCQASTVEYFLSPTRLSERL